ncbi:MAG: LysR family transcriptional regulator [Burkholderiales bacterium]
MDLNQLRSFSCIAREGSLARASALLFLSPPAVSAQIKALETELQLKLFDRSAKGMVLTSAGTALLLEANKALDAASNVSAKAKNFRNESIMGEFQLGTISDPVMLRLGEFLTILVGQYPGLKPSLCQGISGDIISRVVDKKIQAGYIFGEANHDHISSIKIAPIVLRVVAPVKWKEQLIEASWEDIVTFPWISTPENCSFRSIASKMFARHNVTPRVVIEADQERLLGDLVAQGIGLSLLREDIAVAAEAEGKIAIWSSGMEIDHLYFIYRDTEGESPLMQAIIPIIHQVWQIPPDPRMALFNPAESMSSTP